jgi:hypothetical protein
MDAYEFTYALYSCIYNAKEQKQAKYPRSPQFIPNANSRRTELDIWNSINVLLTVIGMCSLAEIEDQYDFFFQRGFYYKFILWVLSNQEREQKQGRLAVKRPSEVGFLALETY